MRIGSSVAGALVRVSRSTLLHPEQLRAIATSECASGLFTNPFNAQKHGHSCACSNCMNTVSKPFALSAPQLRGFASDADKASTSGQDDKAAQQDNKAEASTSGEAEAGQSDASMEELLANLKEKEAAAGKLTEQVRTSCACPHAPIMPEITQHASDPSHPSWALHPCSSCYSDLRA